MAASEHKGEIMKEYFKVLFGGVGVVLTFTILGWVLLPANLFMERVAVKQSFQYKEGMAQQAAIWEAILVDLEEQLMTCEPTICQGIEGQKRVIKSRLRAVTINQ